MGTLDICVLAGYVIWPKGDTGLHTCRVYETFQEASDAAQEHADSRHRPYEVRVAYEAPTRIIRTFEPRRRK